MNLLSNRYQLLELIGQGGMGTVYRAIHIQTGEIVAIKQVRLDIVGDDPEMIERFIREGEALRQLNHPNIVRMLAAGNEEGSHYIVMEYVNGGTLYDLLKQHPQMSVERTVSIALELADALTRAHHLKIIHRDIKPANVLIAEDGTPRLTDFGIARTHDSHSITQTGVTIGTPDYLSPEALMGEEIDPRTDIWAFGVMLFEKLAGKRPFEAPTLTGVMTAILTQPVPDLEALRPDAPTTLVDLIYRMLEKDLKQRIPSMRQVGAELEAIQQGTPARAAVAGISHSFDTPTPTFANHNLPTPTTPFVGREAEITELIHLLASNRLVTILAPGGMGKTRLALEVGTQSVSHSSFTGGVYFVDLAPLASPEQLVATIANAVGFQFYAGGEPKQQLLDYLRIKHLLLIMDNFEHLLEGAPVVTEILQAALNVKVLVTSREKLNLRGETVYTISGMDFPDWETPEDALQYSAVKLFMQAAKRAKAGFELELDHLKYVARICRLVQGMPLGIELAAAWIEVLSLQEIADEISKSLDFLETEMRDVPTRHRSIRAVFDYSWNLMHEEQQAVFAKLSVFRSGFTREAAQEVAGANLRMLSAVVNKSLLRRNPASGRYEVHELLRQYGEKQLEAFGLMSAAQDAHATYYMKFMQRQWEGLKGKRQKDALDEIEADFENVRLAWFYSIDNNRREDLYNAASSVYFYTDMRDRIYDRRDFFQKALDTLRVRSEDHIVGHLLTGMAWAHLDFGLFLEGQKAAERAIALLDKAECPEELIMAYISLGMVQWFMGQPENALIAYNRGLEIAEASQNRWGLGQCLYFKSVILVNTNVQQNLQQITELSQRGLEFTQRTGDVWIEACITGLILFRLAHESGNHQQAVRYAERSLMLYRSINKQWGVGSVYHNLGVAEHIRQEYARAKQYYLQALRVKYIYTTPWQYIYFVADLAEIEADTGNFADAVAMFSSILHHPAVQENLRNRIEAKLLEYKPRLDEQLYAAAVERGKKLDFDTLVRQLLAQA